MSDRGQLIASSSRLPRWAPDAVFAAICVASLAALLVIGYGQWFFLDEFDFLADRTAWNVDDLFRPHNEHWSTIPILLYRGLFRIFGLNSYLPYRAMAVTSHLLCAVLMRMVLRRIGVGPWLSIAVVLPWIFFGSGWQDIVWGFQIAWTLALALALVLLLLADHDGPRDWRDLLGFLAGAAALMCSGIAPPLIASVSFALWLRRGWRVAAVLAVPLAAVQLLWSSLYGTAPFIEWPTTDNLAFVWRGLSGTVEAYAWTWFAALVLTAAVVVGLVLRWGRTSGAERRSAFAIPLGLGLGVAGYLLLVSFGRVAFGLDFATSSRYLHITAFLLLPLVGLGIAELHQRATELPRTTALGVTAALVLVLWAGLPGNVGEFWNAHPARRFHKGNPTMVRAVATMVADDPVLPRDGRPTTAASDASIGWLQDAIHDGYLDPLTDIDPEIAEVVRQNLQLVQVDEDFDGSGECTPMDDPITRDLEPGDRLSFSAFQVKAEISSAAEAPLEKVFNAFYGESIQATAPVHVVFTNVHPAKQAELCG